MIIFTSIIAWGFFVTMLIVFVKFFFRPSGKDLIDEINKKERENHFSGIVLETFIDTTDRHLRKVILKVNNDTITFWPQFIDRIDHRVQNGDSLIKFKDSFTYHVKRGDSTFVIQVKPFPYN
jgi:hypothetical protein